MHTLNWSEEADESHPSRWTGKRERERRTASIMIAHKVHNLFPLGGPISICCYYYYFQFLLWVRMPSNIRLSVRYSLKQHYFKFFLTPQKKALENIRGLKKEGGGRKRGRMRETENTHKHPSELFWHLFIFYFLSFNVHQATAPSSLPTFSMASRFPFSFLLLLILLLSSINILFLPA